MASSGAAEKTKIHEGSLKPYAHEELGQPNGVSSVVLHLFVVE